jgi:hypothetical protein
MKEQAMDLEAEVKRLKEKLTSMRADNAALTKHLDHGLRTRDARDAIASAGGNVALLLPLVMSTTRTRRDGDNYVTEVVGDDGFTRIRDADNNMTMADLVAEMREQFPRAFQGQTRNAGATPDGSPAPERFEGTLAQRTAFIRARIGGQLDAATQRNRTSSPAPTAPSTKPFDDMTLQEKTQHLRAKIARSEA